MTNITLYHYPFKEFYNIKINIKMKILNNATMVEVRTPEEFLNGYIFGTINIPLEQLQQRINEKMNYQNR